MSPETEQKSRGTLHNYLEVLSVSLIARPASIACQLHPFSTIAISSPIKSTCHGTIDPDCCCLGVFDFGTAKLGKTEVIISPLCHDQRSGFFFIVTVNCLITHRLGTALYIKKHLHVRKMKYPFMDVSSIEKHLSDFTCPLQNVEKRRW